MKFRTETECAKSRIEINHQTKILMLGSCFTNSIGQNLINNKFDVNLNPFGTLYNPVSIKNALNLLIEEKKLAETDLFFDKGLYNSFYHHSSFSHSDKKQCLDKINATMKEASARIREMDLLFITFGTSYVYEYTKTKEVVGNCHKLPASHFKRYRLSLDSIANEWESLINRLKSINPKLNIIFTVSPIRHLRDGAHDNQLSKSTLLLAIDELNSKFENIHYFPSYEIVLDDLRDYRFYEQDMIHPNSLAVEYIWKKLAESYFSENTIRVINEWEKLNKSLNHRPFNDDSKEFISFLEQTLLKLNEFSKKYPFICVNSERTILEKQIK